MQATDSKKDSSSLTFTSLFPNEHVGSLSVFEAFHQFRADYEQASTGTFRLWYASQSVRLEYGELTCHSCLTETAPVIKRLFSYFRLFTLSAYSEPQFWARALLAFLLCWSGYASQEFVDVILQSSDDKSNAVKSHAFCLPSRGIFLFESGLDLSNSLTCNSRGNITELGISLRLAFRCARIWRLRYPYQAALQSKANHGGNPAVQSFQ